MTRSLCNAGELQRRRGGRVTRRGTRAAPWISRDHEEAA